MSEILGGQSAHRYMKICKSSYRAQWRSQEVEVDRLNILSSSYCLGGNDQTYGGELRVKRPRFEVEARIESEARD